ncbi:uncharacterized protein LOC129218129 isoform X1 [Uloborus diversus]|uniref:uncharacterized protein LOC129218129 isoform X1 n=1 Tax=Uloborus diversus TaxID=327109 RepID=UPI00240A4DFC|nr:uncharacterized protein LOC129218129 isoform X1 [Uloborus diversus]
MSFPSPNKATRMLTNSSISSQGSPKYAAESLNACLNDECFDSNNKSTVAPKALESTFFDINSIKSYLETKCGAVSEYLLSIDGSTKCIFFQDLFMKDIFNFFPDRLCIDLSYKFFQTNIFMYLFLCDDSNGKNFIVSLGFSQVDDPECTAWLYSTFKRHNPNWRRTKLILADPKLKYRDVVRTCFPSPYILICFYHAVKTFKKAIDTIQGFSSDEHKQYTLELFKNMYLAHTHAEYEVHYQQFLALHSEVVAYFQEFWIPLQYQWRTGLDYYHEDIFFRFNQYLEKLDNSIKPFFLKSDNLCEFIKKLFIIINLIRKETSSIAINSSPNLYSRFSPEFQISKVLTPFAAKFVIEQLNLSSEINMEYGVLADSYFFDYLGTSVTASSSICSCQFYMFTLLPCRHIFAVRKVLSLCVFDEALSDYFWNVKFYQNTLTCMQTLSNNSTLEMFSNPLSKQVLTSNTVEEILPVLLDCPKSIFESRYEVLRQIVSSWKKEEDVVLQFTGVELYTQNNNSQDIFSNESPKIDKSEIKPTNIPKKMKYIKEKPKRKHSPVPDIVAESSKWNFKSQILNGKFINYAYLCRVICNTKEDCVDWLKEMDLIVKTMVCPTCGFEMKIKKMPRLSDGAIWFCSNVTTVKRKSCSKRCSIRRGSWFELTNITLEQILAFCYMWINGFSQDQIISESGISAAAYVWLNKFCTRVCKEILFDDKSDNKMEQLSSAQILDAWLNSCGDEDSFVRLLKNAAVIHQQDNTKHSIP